MGAARHRVRVLGVDPGSLSTGWGLLGGEPARPSVIDCGEIRPARSLAFADRLAVLQREFDAVLERLAPDEAAVEAPFHGVSARSALQLAHARGVLLASLAARGVTVAEYSPATVKKSVTGNGRAEKRQVHVMVRGLLGPAADSAGHDLSDALAVGLCHLATRAFAGAVERAGRRG